MDNTFMGKVEKTSKKVEKISTAIITTVSCVIVTVGLINKLLKKSDD